MIKMHRVWSNASLKAFGALLLLLVLIFMNNKTKTTNGNLEGAKIVISKREHSNNEYDPIIVHEYPKIVLTSCGSNHINTVTIIKSAILFSSRVLEFNIITEKANEDEFVKQFESWPDAERKKFTYQFTGPFYPSDGLEWNKVPKLCASVRLFVADILNTTDAIIFLDTDAVFFDDAVLLWEEFKNFDQKQIIAFARDYYNKHKYSNGLGPRIPFYGPHGINSGVVLMNLTRIREFKMYEKLVVVFQKYKDVIVYGEQCLLNALFSQYLDRVYDLDCSWNFFFTYCFGEVCPSTNNSGIKILHGAGATFSTKWAGPKFRLAHEAFKKYNFNGTKSNIYLEIKQAFENTSESRCLTNTEALLKPLAKLET